MTTCVNTITLQKGTQPQPKALSSAGPEDTEQDGNTHQTSLSLGLSQPQDVRSNQKETHPAPRERALQRYEATQVEEVLTCFV